MIYTSYFANWRKFPPGAKVIGMARIMRFNNNWGQWLAAAPSEKLLKQWKNKQITEEQFAEIYLRELQIDKEKTRQQLWQLEEQYNNVVLCCYEKKGDFCHRHILAEWLDMGIEEL